MKQKIVEFLLNNADPSIILRVKKEVLDELPAKEETELLDKIITQKNVQSVIQSQKPDGWFGNHFHGMSAKFDAGMFDNMEVGLRYLAEKGFPPGNEYIKKAVYSFLLREPFSYAVYRFRPPEAPDTDYTYTAFGLYLFRSSIIIRAGYEDTFPDNDFIDLKHDIDFSLKNFVSVLNLKSVDDAFDMHTRKYRFKRGVLFPCMYHLRILAHSQSWRSEGSVSLLADSLERLFTFPQSGEDVYTYIKGQYIAPAWAFIHKPLLGSTNGEAVGSIWFDLMELYARCGIVKRVGRLKNEYESMLERIDENLNLNIDFSKRASEIGWGPYTGIALETDWKMRTRKQCDLLFRVLLIIHYSECN